MLRIWFVALAQTLRARMTRGRARPTWSFSFETMLRFLRIDWEETDSWDIARLRADHEVRPYPKPSRKLVLRDEAVGGVPARWFVPPGADGKRMILFFHGGSFLYGSPHGTHANVIGRIALATGITVVAPEYRLAPEHPFPAQIEDALAAFAGLLDTGKSARDIVVAGDSAGGNLAIELQLALRDRGSEQAAGAALISPWCDLEMPGASFVENDRYDFGTRKTLVRDSRLYAGDVPLDDPRISPIRAELGGLSPVLVIAGEVEIPRDDILAFVGCLESAGVDVTLHVAPDMPHNPPVFAAYHPNGQRALDEIARFVERALKDSAVHDDA